MEGLKPEENESMVTNWEGKEMEELLEAFRTKFEPSERTRTPRVFGEKLGDEFVTKFSDKLGDH